MLLKGEFHFSYFLIVSRQAGKRFLYYTWCQFYSLNLNGKARKGAYKIHLLYKSFKKIIKNISNKVSWLVKAHHLWWHLENQPAIHQTESRIDWGNLEWNRNNYFVLNRRNCQLFSKQLSVDKHHNQFLVPKCLANLSMNGTLFSKHHPFIIQYPADDKSAVWRWMVLTLVLYNYKFVWRPHDLQFSLGVIVCLFLHLWRDMLITSNGDSLMTPNTYNTFITTPSIERLQKM